MLGHVERQRPSREEEEEEEREEVWHTMDYSKIDRAVTHLRCCFVYAMLTCAFL